MSLCCLQTSRKNTVRHICSVVALTFVYSLINVVFWQGCVLTFFKWDGQSVALTAKIDAHTKRLVYSCVFVFTPKKEKMRVAKNISSYLSL